MHLKGALSFQQKLQKFNNPESLTILLYPSNKTHILQTPSDNVLSLTKKTIYTQNCCQLTAIENKLSSITANMIGFSENLLILNKHVCEQNSWVNSQYQSQDDFNVYINPKILEVSNSQVSQQQEICPVIPFLSANVKRYYQIQVGYMDENENEQTEELEGFKATVFQHELDHLKGVDFMDWRVNLGEIDLIEMAAPDFPQFKNVLQEYKNYINKMLKGFPQLKVIRTMQDLNLGYLGQNYQEKPSFEETCLTNLYESGVMDILKREQLQQ